MRGLTRASLCRTVVQLVSRNPTLNNGDVVFTIVDSDGTELVTSDGPSGNIGCPITEEECAHFIKMLEKTIRRAPEGRVAEIAKALDEYAKKRR